jgi:hypothetical protein
MNPWNNRFHTNLERTHETYKFAMLVNNKTIASILKEGIGQ